MTTTRVIYLRDLDLWRSLHRQQVERLHPAVQKSAEANRAASEAREAASDLMFGAPGVRWKIDAPPS